jgi:hypothetical protein
MRSLQPIIYAMKSLGAYVRKVDGATHLCKSWYQLRVNVMGNFMQIAAAEVEVCQMR